MKLAFLIAAMLMALVNAISAVAEDVDNYPVDSSYSFIDEFCKPTRICGAQDEEIPPPEWTCKSCLEAYNICMHVRRPE